MPMLPILYQKKKNGVAQWEVGAVTGPNDAAVLRKCHGYVGGAIQVNDKVIRTGKNLGKANATTPFQQAESEAQSAWQKQLDKGYVEDPSGESNVLLPMKAQDFTKSGHRIIYPAYGQPKMNGVRCLAKRTLEGIEFTSRGGKSYNDCLQHLVDPLMQVMAPGQVFDGEIYIPDTSLQQIVRLVKKYRPGDSEALQYWIYDMVNQQPYKDRLLYLRGLFEVAAHRGVADLPGLRIVDTIIIDTPDEVVHCHDRWVEDGFEGAIVRNADGKYEVNQRTHNLQKYKSFQDKEVEIIGGKSGEGLEDGCVVFVVKDEFGNEFTSRPKGTREVRKQWLDDIDQLIGKQLTIRYFELSEDGVPQQNRGIAIRDYE